MKKKQLIDLQTPYATKQEQESHQNSFIKLGSIVYVLCSVFIQQSKRYYMKTFLQTTKIKFALIISLLIVTDISTQAQLVTSQNHGTGLEFLPDSVYAKLPKANWDTLKKNSLRALTVSQSTSGITMLYTPPVGAQGQENSCVGWAVGYTAFGILEYSKYNNWNDARRSPGYIYNQIKQYSDCSALCRISDALNLVCNQGDCSWNLMPYVDGYCNTLPNSTQQADAAQNKALQWATLTATDIASIKQAIDLGYPVIIGCAVYQSYHDMFNNGGGIWNTNSGAYYGNHATCIVGYDDNKSMVKVQNQWGTTGGDQGFYWIPYSFIQSGCITEAYILYPTSAPLTPMTLSGESNICTTSSTYTLNNLPTNASLSWSSSSNLNLSSTTSNSATFTTNGNGTGWVKAIVDGVTLSQYTVGVGAPSFPSYTTNPSQICADESYIFTPTLPVNTTITSITGLSDDGEIPLSEIYTGSYEVPASVYRITITLENPCGIRTVRKLIPKGNCSTLTFSVAPNPSSNQVRINIDSDKNTIKESTAKTSGTSTSVTYSVKLLDTFGSIVYTTSKHGKQFSIPVSSLRNGVYTILVSDGHQVYQNKIIVKH